ncbi:MAG: molecular chaperone HtpG [Alphaproteobacteria bacterium]|jgi:chaperone protein htpG|uniref:molecular chaperone HtpG n=1 Tax=Candidatus Scatocola faecigallinarum TaxID=2840916 RepID=UPI00033C0079|nr:chaperone protein HtpG [Azospirillum sp. CAG:239]
MSDKLNFQADVSKMLDIVVNSLYSEKQIFLRELISNASDACDKLKYMALTHPDIARESGKMKIWITPDAEKNTLTVADNGIGMNRDDLINHLGTIAKSGTADFVKNASDNGSAVDLIGQFGVGFYSAFMVADKVEILTRRAGEDKAWFWVSNGVDGFEIREAEKKTNGTEIKLFLKQDERNYTDSIYLRQIIRTYSDHINYPIVLCLGKAGEETVNSASALWTRNKAEITPEQYKEFYHHVSKNFDEPWMTLHFKAEGSIEYTGLLYIPGTAPYDLFQPDRKQGLKLYVNRVFISEKVEELLPSYLRFVRGIIDSSDLPLNISREMLQQSPLIAKIRQGTVSRILKELKKRSKDYEDYKKFWDAFGIAFKEGIYEDFANREEIAGLSRFVSTNDTEKLTSLDDYIGRAQPEQKAIYYITGDDVKTLVNNPQLEAFKEKGLEVLLLTDPIDEFWTQTLGTYKTFAVKHVSQADIDLSFKREGQKAEEGDLKKLTDLLGEMFKNEVGKVTTTDKLTKSPVSLTVEAGQMSIHLERLMRNHQQQTAFASTRILELNPYHPLIIRLAEAMGDEALKPKVEEVARLLLDQAKIAEGECISDPSFYSEKMSEYILKSF